MKAINDVLESYRLIDGLKKELRHSWLSSDRQESVAEHTWGMALLACMLAPHLDRPVRLELVLKMIILHDLAEAEIGDIPIFEESERQRTKFEREQAAIKKIAGMLPQPFAREVPGIWIEFEKGESDEARFVRALDRLEVQLQHNCSDMKFWQPIEYELVYSKMRPVCEYDSVLLALSERVEERAAEKMTAVGVDVESIKRKFAR